MALRVLLYFQPENKYQGRNKLYPPERWKSRHPLHCFVVANARKWACGYWPVNSAYLVWSDKREWMGLTKRWFGCGAPYFHTCSSPLLLSKAALVELSELFCKPNLVSSHMKNLFLSQTGRLGQETISMLIGLVSSSSLHVQDSISIKFLCKNCHWSHLSYHIAEYAHKV